MTEITMQFKNTVIAVAIILVLQLITFQTIAWIKYSYWNHNRISTLRSDYQINLELTDLLKNLPNAARVRIEIIQTVIHTPGRQLPLYRFSTKFAQSAPGETTGPLASDLPLAEWNDFLPDLIDKQCVTELAKQIDGKVLQRSVFSPASTFITCPMVDSHGILIGALFVSWDKDQHPENKATAMIRDSASRITDYLQRRYIDNILDDIILDQYQ